MDDLIKGGAFLLHDEHEVGLFTREDLTDDQIAFANAAKEFFARDVNPLSHDIENQKTGVAIDLLKKAGEQGLLMIEVPESYGGLGMGKTTATAVIEESVSQGSFAVSFMCHTGIGTLPILYFGTPEQKQKYLPPLSSGEKFGAYCLTEAGSGSDALGARTKATLSADGKHYILNGTKQFITNGAWADIFTVFAKVDGDKFTAFIVERGFGGLSHGAEEKKMGIKGSSTTTINLDDCKVPVENVLGEIGKGHKIAFNVLNIGRWKLGAATLGGCKQVLKHMIPYVKERKQFGKPLSDFGLIRKKVADASILTFVTESMMYRIAGLYDDAIKRLDSSAKDYDRQCIEVLEDYAIEASIAKVFGSEALWTVADEGVQALGGYGFTAEYPMEGLQRDSRINRIYEGTNEINRLIIPGTLLKRAMSGHYDMFAEIQRILGELKKGFDIMTTGDFGDGAFKARVDLAKKLTIYISGVAVQKYMQEIKDQQYIMERMANLIIDAYAMDCIMRRTFKCLKAEAENIVPHTKHQMMVAISQVFLAETYEKMLLTAKSLAAEVVDGNSAEYTGIAKALKRFDVFDPINTTRYREAIAQHMLTRGCYEVV